MGRWQRVRRPLEGEPRPWRLRTSDAMVRCRKCVPPGVLLSLLPASAAAGPEGWRGHVPVALWCCISRRVEGWLHAWCANLEQRPTLSFRSFHANLSMTDPDSHAGCIVLLKVLPSEQSTLLSAHVSWRLVVAGTGTMQGPDGSVFTGGWQNDVKFGLGRKVYANGDVYEVRTA